MTIVMFDSKQLELKMPVRVKDIPLGTIFSGTLYIHQSDSLYLKHTDGCTDLATWQTIGHDYYIQRFKELDATITVREAADKCPS